MDKLDQLHVVSDLHLGGVAGHQICNQGPALAAFIEHLARAAPEQRVGLVLNGDIVDFLAANQAEYFDYSGAVGKLQQVFDDDAFRAVWDALARFVATPGRLLVLVLGNHDVELALPHVQDHLLDRISAGRDDARGRIRVAMDGTGYACLVGERRVLCVHGNDDDPWNTIDQGRMREIIKALKSWQRPPEWQPNPGTRLVIDVMNGIKMRYPFVDLLKPETNAVPAVLLALPTELHGPLLEFGKIALRLTLQKARARAGFLGSESEPEVPQDGYRALEQLTGKPPAAPAPRPEDTRGGNDWLKMAASDYSRDLRPTDVATFTPDQKLGMGDLLRDRLTGRDPKEDLRKALGEYLAGDASFRFDTEDDTSKAIDAAVGPEVSFVVAGHTHLERRIARKQGGGVYYNSGTWIRLIQIPEAAIKTPEAFEPLFQALTSGRLSDLDDAGIVVQRRTVVAIWKDGSVVRGELRHAAPAPAPGQPAADPPWEPVAGTQYQCPAEG